MRWPGGLVQTPRFSVRSGQERDRVHAVQRVFVGSARQDELGRRHLARLHRTLDFVGLVERATGVQGDLELAAGQLIDLFGELLVVLGLEGVGGITGGQIPLHLGMSGSGHNQGERQKAAFHEMTP